MSGHLCPTPECARSHYKPDYEAEAMTYQDDRESGNSAGDKDAEIEFLRTELAKATGGRATPTRAYYWIQTMRGEQPRCRKCDGPLTRGPQGGVVDSICPNCGTELRANATPSLERR